MITDIRAPELKFNPIALDFIEVVSSTEVKLKIVKRYVTLNSDKTLSLHAELTDGRISLIIPVKYYIWLALEFTTYVICDYLKFRSANKEFNLVQIRDLNNVNLDIAKVVSNPLADGNFQIPEKYCISYEENCLTKKMLNCYSPGLAYGMGTGSIKSNSIYARGLCDIDTLLDTKSHYKIKYREIDINNSTYITDIELIIGGIS